MLNSDNLIISVCNKYSVKKIPVFQWTALVQSKPLLGSGIRGAILHDSRTSMWGTFSHIHNPTKMEPNHIGTLLSSKRRLHAIERRLEWGPELKVQYYNFMKFEELYHRDPVNSQEGKKTCYCLPYPVFKEKGSTTRTWIAFGGGARL